MTDLTNRLTSLHQRIDAAALRSGRNAGAVRLLAVSKTWPAAVIAQAARLGQEAFGENYLQETFDKIAAAEAQAGRPLEWHFIGPVQSNKTAAIATRFAWVHSVERLKIVQRLSTQRSENLPPLSVCVQVNVSGERSKSGCSPEDAVELCAAAAGLPRLRLRGLMCIPAAVDDAESARPAFRALRALFKDIRAAGAVDPADFDTLSMGMSNYFEVAIEEGATQVRIGSALFGTRTAK